jgi:AcrR family transcriptional regulator
MGGASRNRVMAAAIAEFAARGFDGATVDRIAARARLNKAMLYYHFRGKAALYREILRDVFAGVADAVQAIPGASDTPQAKLRRFVETVAAEAVARPHVPSVWLREMADGGRHLDDAIVVQLARVVAVLADILRQGERQGVFRRAHPFVTHLGIVAPLLLFAASAPVRKKFGPRLAPDVAGIDAASAIHQVQDATLAALAVQPAPLHGRPAAAGRRPTRRARRPVR